MDVKRHIANPLTLRFLRPVTFLLIVFGLTGCAVTRIEDVMGPSASLIQPPPDLAAAVPNLGQSSTVDSGVPPNPPNPPSEEPEADPLVTAFGPAEQVSPILAAQENNSQFSDLVQWQVFRSNDGYDATNASGTLCSGRLISGAPGTGKGQRIPLACSDGKNATLQVSGLDNSGATGLLTIDRVQQTAKISNFAKVP